MTTPTTPLDYSVVVPFFNESENLPKLVEEIDAMAKKLVEDKPGATGEVILVDDGSTDSFEKPDTSPTWPIRWLGLTENSGQSAAMYYGMQAACGGLVILMDADLQNDPLDIPAMVKKLHAEDLDMVTGVRAKRRDTFIRRISSRIANRVRSFILKDHTSDTGCTLKVLKAEAAKRLPGWNGMHRFMPALVSRCGYQIGEMPVNHRERHMGESKVRGASRAIRATVDLCGVIWLQSRQFKGRLKPEE